MLIPEVKKKRERETAPGVAVLVILAMEVSKIKFNVIVLMFLNLPNHMSVGELVKNPDSPRRTPKKILIQ